MHRLDAETRKSVIRRLVEGRSVRATAAGVRDRMRHIEGILGPVDEAAPKPGPRASHRKAISI